MGSGWDSIPEDMQSRAFDTPAGGQESSERLLRRVQGEVKSLMEVLGVYGSRECRCEPAWPRPFGRRWRRL